MNDRDKLLDAVPQARFNLGQVVATPGALQLLQDHGLAPFAFLTRHAAGDWGDVPAEDATANDAALINGDRLLSAYPVGDGRIWLLTEWDRSVTTILLPREY